MTLVVTSDSARTYRKADVKKLFALSYNECALPGCEEKLASPSWPRVLAEICHIYGLQPRAPRHDPTMTDEERNSYENLLLLCRNCHIKVDYLAVDEYPAERLLEIKRSHEERRAGGEWCSTPQLDRYVQQLVLTLGIQLVVDPGQPSAPAAAASPPEGRRLGGGQKRIRIYELARELDLTNEDALELAVSLGVPAKSHSSSIPAEAANRIRSKAEELGLPRSPGPPQPGSALRG